MISVAIIGAGLSGLTAANTLKDHADITIFEKARSVSGRMSTRRAEPYFFDHGAQFFIAKTDAFKAFIEPMIEDGIIRPWTARFVEIENRKIVRRRHWGEDFPHYVGVPGMSAVGKYLSQDLNVRLETHVQSICKNGQKWSLKDNRGNVLGDFDWVISTVPAEQASNIIPSSISFYSKVKSVKMEGCFSLMLGFAHDLPVEFDNALVVGEDISWISVNSSKPERDAGFSLLVHSTNSWADKYRDTNRDQVMRYLCQQTSLIIGHDVSTAEHKALHRWGYANAKKQISATHFIDTAENIGVCGDWLIHGRVEAAFTSGLDLAQNILGELQRA